MQREPYKMQVLVIDNDPAMRRALRVGLVQNGYRAVLAATGQVGLKLATDHHPDFVIMDPALPNLEGLQVCQCLRARSKVPILMLSARGEERHKIAALDAGADDYLTKPFSLNELLARLRAMLRRASGYTVANHEQVETHEHVVTDGLLRLDFTRRLITLDHAPLHLTPTEYELLHYLARHPDRVLTYHQLLTKIWGPGYAVNMHTLRVHVATLRRKIEPDPARPRYLRTEPRIGYRWRVDAAS